MSLQRSPLQRLFLHFQQYYQYLLTNAKVKNKLRCDRGPLEFSVFINPLGYMRLYP